MELSEEVVKYEASLGDAMMKYGMSNETGKMLAKELLAREMQARELLAREMGSHTESQDRRKRSKSRKSKQQNVDSFCGNSVAFSTDGSLRSSRSRWEPNESEHFQHESASLPAEFLYFKFEQIVSRWANMRMPSVMSLGRLGPLLKAGFKPSPLNGPPRTITTIAKPASESTPAPASSPSPAPAPAPSPSPTSASKPASNDRPAKSSTPEDDQNLPRFMRSTNTSATRFKNDKPIRGRSNSPQKTTASKQRSLTVDTAPNNKTPRPNNKSRASPSPARNQAGGKPSPAKNRSPSPFRTSSPTQMTESQKRKRLTMKPPTPKFTGGNQSYSDSAKRSEARGPQNTTESPNAPHYQRRDSSATATKSNLPDPEASRPDPDGQRGRATTRVRSPSPRTNVRSSTPNSRVNRSSPRTTQRGAASSPSPRTGPGQSPQRKKNTKPQGAPEPPKPTTRKKKSRLPPIPSFRNPSPKPQRKEETNGQEEEVQQRDPTPQPRSTEETPQRDPTPQRQLSQADDDQDPQCGSDEQETNAQTCEKENQEMPEDRQTSPSKKTREQSPETSDNAPVVSSSPTKTNEAGEGAAEPSTEEDPQSISSPESPTTPIDSKSKPVEENHSSANEFTPRNSTPSPQNTAKLSESPRTVSPQKAAIRSPQNAASPRSLSQNRTPQAKNTQRQQQNKQESPIRSSSPLKRVNSQPNGPLASPGNAQNQKDRNKFASPRQRQSPTGANRQQRQEPINRMAQSSPQARRSPQPRRYRRMHVFSATVIQSYHRMLPIRREYVLLRHAAVLIQSLCRRRAQMKAYRRLVKGRRLRNFSSAVIQRNFRMAICRNSYHQLKHVTIVIQAVVRMFICRSTYAELITASKKLLGRNLSSPTSNSKSGKVTVRGGRLRIYSALLIQSLARMRWVRAAYIEIQSSAKKIQKWFRNVQKIIQKQNHAATVIQSWVRMASYRECYLDLRANVIIVQAYIRMMCARSKFKHLRLERSAVRIQALYRRKSCQPAYDQLRVATMAIQMWVRGRTARINFLKLRSAVLSLQCRTRQRISTANVLEVRAAVAIQTAFRTFLRTSEYMARRVLLCMVQSFFRRFLEERRYLSLQSAVLTLQKVHRGNMRRRAYAAARRSVLWVENTKMKRSKHHGPNSGLIDADNRNERPPRYDHVLSAALAFVSNPNRSKLRENSDTAFHRNSRSNTPTQHNVPSHKCFTDITPEHLLREKLTGHPRPPIFSESNAVGEQHFQSSTNTVRPDQQPQYRPMPGGAPMHGLVRNAAVGHPPGMPRHGEASGYVGLLNPQVNNMSQTNVGYHTSVESSPGAPRTPPQHFISNNGAANSGLHVPSLQFPRQCSSPSSPYDNNPAHPIHQSNPHTAQQYLQSPGRLLPMAHTPAMPPTLPNNLIPAPPDLVAKLSPSVHPAMQPLYFISQSPGTASAGSPQIYAFQQIGSNAYATQQNQAPFTYYPSPPHPSHQQETNPSSDEDNINAPFLPTQRNPVQQKRHIPSAQSPISLQEASQEQEVKSLGDVYTTQQNQAPFTNYSSPPHPTQLQETNPSSDEDSMNAPFLPTQGNAAQQKRHLPSAQSPTYLQEASQAQETKSFGEVMEAPHTTFASTKVASAPQQNDASSLLPISYTPASQQQEMKHHPEDIEGIKASKEMLRKDTSPDLSPPAASEQQEILRENGADSNIATDLISKAAQKARPGLKGTILEGLRRGRTKRRTPQSEPKPQSFNRARAASPSANDGFYSEDRDTPEKNLYRSKAGEVERKAKENEPTANDPPPAGQGVLLEEVPVSESVPFKQVAQNRYSDEIAIPPLKTGDDSTDRAISQKLAAIRKRSKLRTIQRWSKRTLEERSDSPKGRSPPKEGSNNGQEKKAFADDAVEKWAKQTIQRRKMSIITSTLDAESATQIQSVWRSHRAKILVAAQMLQTWHVACDFSPDTMGNDRIIRQKAHVLALDGAYGKVDCGWDNCKVLKKGTLVLVQWEGLTSVSFSKEGLDADDTCCTVSVQCSVKRSALLDSWSERKCGGLLTKAALDRDHEDQRHKLRRSSMFERSLTRRRTEVPSKDDSQMQSEINLTGSDEDAPQWLYHNKATVIQNAHRTLQSQQVKQPATTTNFLGVPDDFHLRMQVYSAVLIQSWYRMCVCRSMYQGLRRIQSRISMRFDKDGSPIKFHRFFEKHKCETIVEEGFECADPPPGDENTDGDDYDYDF